MPRERMIPRVAFSAVAIPVAVLAAWVGGWVLAGLLALVGVLATREVYDLAAAAGVAPLRRSGLAAAAVAPLATFWAKGSEIHFAEPALYLGALWVLGVLTAAAWRRGPGDRPLAAVSVTVFAVLYAPGLLCFAIVLRHPAGVGLESSTGTALLFFPLALTWIGDTAAMAGGKLIGGPKLAPGISPGKTWAGTIGGAACAALVFGCYTAIIGVAVGPTMLFALFLSAVAQGGDLFESFVKRRFGLKDSSSLIPGHGGVLDRLDSTFAAASMLALLVFALQFDHLFGGHS